MARVAVISGTATAVSNRVSRRQANRWAQEDQAAYAQQPQPQYAQPAPPPPTAAPAQDDVYAQLRKLAELKDAGILTDEEFAAKKAQLLGV
jgi:hypothetical protein